MPPTSKATLSCHEFTEVTNNNNDKIPVETKETVWIDAWIRWERDSKEVVDEDDFQDEEITPPTETFSFSYSLPNLDEGTDNGSSRDASIHLELKGFPSESEQIWNSTGLTLWPCSQYLCDYLVENHASLLHTNTQRILELGSGLGRCGLLLHQLLVLTQRKQSPTTIDTGECHVFLTDGDTDTLAQLRANVEHNTNATDNNNDSISTTISCRQLLWGRDTAQPFLHRQEGPMDLIIGSDLIYVPKVIGPLFETVSELLAPDGKFIMAHSNRRQGSAVTLEMVLEAAEKDGFGHDIVMQSPPQEGISVIVFQRLR